MSKHHRMANLDLNTLDDLESTARTAVDEVTQQQNILYGDLSFVAQRRSRK